MRLIDLALPVALASIAQAKKKSIYYYLDHSCTDGSFGAYESCVHWDERSCCYTEHKVASASISLHTEDQTAYFFSSSNPYCSRLVSTVQGPGNHCVKSEGLDVINGVGWVDNAAKVTLGEGATEERKANRVAECSTSVKTSVFGLRMGDGDLEIQVESVDSYERLYRDFLGLSMTRVDMQAWFIRKGAVFVAQEQNMTVSLVDK
ncbi:hypothetical protein EJ05DRAFT_471473 [Pseudovirgaria hyperparasitica]|uniref:Uncharacterized protein n=1 Tax=Pseudovirgaria hyperparasitica TaxID=470096 RepID=A0A6A6WI23_9PEZI|nr:uncharacterized protein EJ05DRAFT_471473 [Pseudovirgaria hyperparasitica]KAF2762448.1 hypothetical protein EJ05DRAFT_471473 [Pseudovirgaria hyperparasitica]